MRIYVVSKNPLILTDNNIFTTEEDAELCALQLGQEYKIYSYYVNEKYLIKNKCLWRVIIYNNLSDNNITVERVIGKSETDMVRYNSDKDHYLFLISAYSYEQAMERAKEHYKDIIKNKGGKYDFLKEKLISKKTDYYHQGKPYKHPMYEFGTDNIVLLNEEYINYAALTMEQVDIISKFNINYIK